MSETPAVPAATPEHTTHHEYVLSPDPAVATATDDLVQSVAEALCQMEHILVQNRGATPCEWHVGMAEAAIAAVYVKVATVHFPREVTTRICDHDYENDCTEDCLQTTVICSATGSSFPCSTDLLFPASLRNCCGPRPSRLCRRCEKALG